MSSAATNDTYSITPSPRQRLGLQIPVGSPYPPEHTSRQQPLSCSAPAPALPNKAPGQRQPFRRASAHPEPCTVECACCMIYTRPPATPAHGLGCLAGQPLSTLPCRAKRSVSGAQHSGPRCRRGPPSTSCVRGSAIGSAALRLGRTASARARCSAPSKLRQRFGDTLPALPSCAGRGHQAMRAAARPGSCDGCAPRACTAAPGAARPRGTPAGRRPWLCRPAGRARPAARPGTPRG